MKNMKVVVVTRNEKSKVKVECKSGKRKSKFEYDEIRNADLV